MFIYVFIYEFLRHNQENAPSLSSVHSDFVATTLLGLVWPVAHGG